MSDREREFECDNCGRVLAEYETCPCQVEDRDPDWDPADDDVREAD